MSDAAARTSKSQNPLKGWIKLTGVAVLLICAIALIAFAVTEPLLDSLKHVLSPGLIIALVVLVNLIFLLFAVIGFAVYQWIRKDFRGDAYPHPDEDSDQL